MPSRDLGGSQERKKNTKSMFSGTKQNSTQKKNCLILLAVTHFPPSDDSWILQKSSLAIQYHSAEYPPSSCIFQLTNSQQNSTTNCFEWKNGKKQRVLWPSWSFHENWWSLQQKRRALDVSNPSNPNELHTELSNLKNIENLFNFVSPFVQSIQAKFRDLKSSFKCFVVDILSPLMWYGNQSPNLFTFREIWKEVKDFST